MVLEQPEWVQVPDLTAQQFEILEFMIVEIKENFEFDFTAFFRIDHFFAIDMKFRWVGLLHMIWIH